jgi:glucosylceramidase
MKKVNVHLIRTTILATSIALSVQTSVIAQASGNASIFITNPDKSLLLSRQELPVSARSSNIAVPEIQVDESEKYQSIEGFGFALTGGSAMLINEMEPGPKKALLDELFRNGESGIGTSYLRISIGASDLSDRVFSYDDLKPGETDPEMKKFSIEPEKKDLIPVLKQILAINPGIKILGSPWSPPVWMKTNGNSKGGSLKPEFYDAYAKYFVKYINSMKSEGITIDAITIQNEPLHPGNNPSMYMPAAEQAAFIKKSLGPAFKREGIDTKIIIYDHNPLHAEYPLEVLADPEAAQYVDGTAFHMYEGSVDAIQGIHDKYPDKNLYFTEQWVGAPGSFSEDLRWHVKTLIIMATRYWCRNVIEWNLAADPNQDPHTEGGCTECLGAVTIDGNKVTRNSAWYIISHASEFVPQGSVRIKSNLPDGLPNVAFKTPSGKIVVIVVNDSDSVIRFAVTCRNKTVTPELRPGAVGTIVW